MTKEKKVSPVGDFELRVAAQFPEIEKMLETEDFDRINKDFTAAYEGLEKLSKGPGGIGKASKAQEARKAMRAIERVMDLLRELLMKK